MKLTVDACHDLPPEPAQWHEYGPLQTYAAFKLGFHPAVGRYAVMLADRLANLLEDSDPGVPLLMASPPYADVPSAATLLARRTAERLAATGAPHRVEVVEYRRRARRRDLPRHYAHLTEADRTRYMAQERSAWIPAPDVSGRFVVLIDDVRITGTQEVELVEFTREQGAERIHYQYLFRLASSSSSPPSAIEPTLNKVGIETDDKFLQFIADGDYSVTTRFLWRLLELPQEVFDSAISLFGPDQCADIVRGARPEGAPNGAIARKLAALMACVPHDNRLFLQ